MIRHKTLLSEQEKNWILSRRLTRLTDNQEILIYPMGAERYLSSVLFGEKKANIDIVPYIAGKHVLLIPGYGNNSFLCAAAGAASVTVYDKDPVTIAWIKAFKAYYHYKEYDPQGMPYPSIGALLSALTAWYPPLIKLPLHTVLNSFLWLINPQQLRRTYLLYMMSLVCQAISRDVQEDFEWEKNIQFYTGELSSLPYQTFDTAYVPYLLGVCNGIEQAPEIISFMKQLLQLVPKGHILVSPSRDNKEFHILGKRYFVTTKYPSIQSIPEIAAFCIAEDDGWFRKQGLAVFGASQTP
jgi:hypothetical protein